jgi:hypothetical protein
MDIRLNKTYFLVPLFYIAVIFGLLFLQFSKRGEKFFDSFPELILSGITAAAEPKNGEQKEIEELHLRYKGIDFAFGSRYRAQLVFEDGSSRDLILGRYQKTEMGFTLNFDRDVKLDFIPDSAKDILSIHAEIGKRTAGSVQALVMGFSAVDGAKVNNVERMPILSVDHKEKNYLLSLPEKSSIDMARQLLVVVPSGDSALITFGPSSEGTKESFRQWYANQMGGATPPEALSQKVTEYINGAYQGWKTGRYSAEGGVWLTEGNTQAFKETLVTAYLAESLQRGDYSAARAQVQQTAQNHARSVSFISSPYLGNLQELFVRLLQDDEKESARLLSQVRSRNNSVWNRGDLLRFAALRGSPGLKDEILRFAAAANLHTLSFPSALGMLQNYYETLDADPESADVLRRSTELINTKVFPSIIKIAEGFFLENESGKIDVYLSVLAGRILIRAGKAEKDPVLESIGRDLIISALNLSDRQGFLPKNILFADMILRGTEGRIAPEDIYSLLVDNPYYPRFIDLGQQLGPGAWLYTGANMRDVNISPARNIFRFQFPMGQTHHFVFRGAKPYTEIQLWKISWRIDANFERYNIGAYFIPERNLFMAKYNHRNREEEFLMSFAPVPDSSATE